MSLNFILGKPGSGKTHYCMNEILSRQIEDEQNNKAIIYIVPEQFSLQSERLLIEFAKGKGLFRASVTGFNRLAYSIFSEVGLPDKKLFDDMGKNMLVRKILTELKGELKYYTSAHDKQGFIDGICDQISEFHKYQINPQKLHSICSNTEDSPLQESLKLKMLDLYNIFERYINYQQREYISSDETLDILAEKINNSKLIEGADIFIDGYKSFTPQEYKVIKAIMLKAENIFVTLTMDNELSQKNNAFFEETQKTYSVLRSIASDASVNINKDILLNDNYRHKNSPDLNHIQNNYFHYPPNEYKGNCDNIHIYSADNIEDEIHGAAKLIISLCREKSFRYDEIAVITSVLPDYEKSISAIFRQYDIPVFIDATSDILSHPLTEWVRSFINITVSNWQYDSVFRMLKTNLTKISISETDILENYVLAYGIKGFKWKKPFTYGFKKSFYDAKNNEDSILLNRIREDVVSIASIFESSFDGKFSKRKKYDIKSFCEIVYNALIINNIPEKLSETIDNLNQAGNIQQASEYVQAWDKIMEVLEKMVEILGKEQVTLQEFAKILDAGLMKAKMGMAPSTLDSVVVGDLRRSRFGKIKALLILGANEGMIPEKIDDTGIFTDDEKEHLKKNYKIELAPTSIARAYEERFLIYNALTKPSEFLGVSYFRGTLSGKSYKKSPIIDNIAKIVNVQTHDVSAEKYTFDGITNAKPMFNGISSALRSYISEDLGEQNDVFMDIYSYFCQNIDYKEKVEKWEMIIENTGSKERLSDKTIKMLYSNKKIRASVSKLEKYVQCPFSYFLNYNIRAKERKTYELADVDLGTIFHSTLNRFAMELIKSGREWKNIDEAELDRLTEKSVSGALQESGNEIFSASGQYSHFGQRIKNIAKKSLWALNEHMNKSNFSLSYSEAVFTDENKEVSTEESTEENQDNQENLGLIKLSLEDDAEMLLEGRIDRIDMLDLYGNKFIKIMDYKSSKKTFHFAEAYYGLQLQLILYLDAFIKKCVEKFGEEYADKILPGAMLYFSLANPLISVDSDISDDKLYSIMLKEYKMSGLVLKNKEVIKSLDNEIGKTSDIIPVSMIKGAKGSFEFEDMEFSKKAKVLSVEGFGKLLDYAVKKAEQIGNDILSGKIEIFPYSFKNAKGCHFCKFRSICLFDPTQTGNEFNCFKNTDEKKVASIILDDE